MIIIWIAGAVIYFAAAMLTVIAVTARKKVKPIKPEQPEGDLAEYCPVCGCEVGWTDALAWEHSNFCANCGAELDWSEKWEGPGDE